MFTNKNEKKPKQVGHEVHFTPDKDGHGPQRITLLTGADMCEIGSNAGNSAGVNAQPGHIRNGHDVSENQAGRQRRMGGWRVHKTHNFYEK